MTKCGYEWHDSGFDHSLPCPECGMTEIEKDNYVKLPPCPRCKNPSLIVRIEYEYCIVCDYSLGSI